MRKTVKVRTDKGKLLLDFYYKNVRCREYLGIDNTKQNWRFAERLASEIEQKILLDTLDYAEYFPESKKLELLGIIRKKEYLFCEYANNWLVRTQKKVEAELMDKGTLRAYITGYKKLKESEFWYKKLNEITKIDVEDYITYLAKNKKNKTVNNLLIPCRLILKSAFEEDLLTKDLAKFVKSLKNEKVDIDPFTAEEVISILKHFEQKYQHLHLFFAVGFFTGMRLSEIIGMLWKNFDFNRNTYLVNNVIVNGQVKNKTKTVESHREIVLPDILIPIIHKHKQYTYLKSEYVFVNQYNKPFTRPDKIAELYWKPALKKLGFRYRNMYQMRHTHAILSILAGDNVHDIAKRLGHTNLETFFRRYAKYLKDYLSKSKISDLFSKQNCRKLSETDNT
ncbi:site-specific integrase [Deferribacterales bacterium Es71-Z0220]|uniref:site-specific integrase n=1 Tax=Deferrivibrio essentukiensis TaxID=2880922 RepID=UPI001F61F975|nr:site-specific integrase [Deferrivibrio essentukiensis]MCB4204524.1 site-specific integrase [Deferrivibrio essentukiensis]